MTNMKATKRALISSVFALVLCFAMLLGTTYAWFTDEVTSEGNIIQSGTLDIEMAFADGKAALDAETDWADAADAPIFNYDNWEPGYVDAKHIQVTNVGTLAVKYQMRIIANGAVSTLAEVIDVYYFAEGQQLTDRTDLQTGVKLGTLAELMGGTNNISTQVAGTLMPKGQAGDQVTMTFALVMQETAGNDYQNLSIGSSFSIQLIATQYTYETDAFDNQYDADADFAPMDDPKANVSELNEDALNNINIYEWGNLNTPLATGLDTGYCFLPNETYEQSLASESSWYHADFFVYADNDVAAESIILAGYYAEFAKYIDFESNQWIGLIANVDTQAGAENGVRLLGDGMSGVTVAYNEICKYANDGIGFLCGAKNLSADNIGTTITVELRLYETYSEEEALELFGEKSHNYETGEYEVVGTFTYTFGE